MLTKEDLSQIAHLMQITFAQGVEELINPQFDKVWEKFDSVDKRFEAIDEHFEKLEGRVEGLEGQVGHLRSGMVTKEYLDDRLADLKADLLETDKKQEEKLNSMVAILTENKTITSLQAERLHEWDAFRVKGSVKVS